MTADELRKWIDVCYDAVDQSKAGPIFMKDMSDQYGRPAANILAIQTFQSVLQCVLPKGPQRFVAETPKEPWQGE